MAAAQHAIERREQLIGMKWLDHPAGGTGLFALLLALLARFGRQQQQGGQAIVRKCSQMSHQGDAIHARHIDVGQDQIH